MLFDQTVSVVEAVARWLEFYKHESCGKCTPCREGTYWITGMLERFGTGKGETDAARPRQVPVLADRRTLLLRTGRCRRDPVSGRS
jgi:NADH:ubiquinone oxidoreductase subunit F (NADH-binding)